MSTDGRHDPVADGDLPVGELSYTAASRELDGIVEFFEKSEVDVDQLVARLERATAIVDELDRRIRQTRAQVEELVPKLEAAGRAVADPGAGAGGGGTVEAGVAPDEATVDTDGGDGHRLPF